MDQMGVHYNIWIILLSFALSVTAAYSALNLVSQISRSHGKARELWLLSAACVLGSGIWAVHFVGMIALRLPFSISYRPGYAILSMLAGMAVSYMALRTIAGEPSRMRRLIIGGLLLGSAISVIHFLGISSMQMAAPIRYNYWIQGLSVLATTSGTGLGVLLFGSCREVPKRKRRKMLSALVIGLSVMAMHFISLGGTRFPLGGQPAAAPEFMGTDILLLIGVSIVIVFMFGISGAAAYLDRHMLERMAYHDPLTDLPNRHGLHAYFNDRFFLDSGGAVLFVDLDPFKSINDTLGHDIGDMLLQEVADRLRHSVDPRGKVFRLGGDEFLIAIPGCSSVEAETEAGRILQVIKKSYSIQENELYVTASIGISLAPDHGLDRSSLMKAADTALYTSKDSGKNKYTMFDQEMNRNQLRRMLLEKDLRKALARSEFMVVYQPKWDSLVNVTVGLEALLRWRHPEHGLISPAEFIPIAEETGLIVPITYWMLHEVCTQNMNWHQESVAEVAVSINMSARMFEGGNLYDFVDEALTRSGLPPKYLELEITESIAMNNMEETVAQLSKLRNLGVRVSLDDFGTGFSSLGNLDEIPVNTLKIDQVFIRKSQMHSKKAIISNIIAIASNLDMDVVAEGVETTEQIELLQSLGCRVMQGYYYGRPMPVQELGQWFSKNAAAV